MVLHLKGLFLVKIQSFTNAYKKEEVGLFVNGTLHLDGTYWSGSWEIVTLDFSTKTHGKIALPSY